MKSICKCLIIFLVLSFLISCDGSNISDYNQKPEISDKGLSDNNTKIVSDIVIGDNFIKKNNLVIRYPSYTNMRYAFMDSWRELLFDKLNIDIKIDYNSVNPDDIRTGIFDQDCIIYLSYTDYFTYEMNSDVLKYSDDQICYNLSPYYIKYGWDKYFDNEYLKSLVFDGDIYAVPASSQPYIIPRHYRKEFLDSLGIAVPKTTMELYRYLQAVKAEKADAFFYPMCIDSQRITPSTSDIFRAFGCYVNSQANSTVSYNPKTQSFEDAVFSEDFDQALTYFRTLQSEGLLFLAGYSESAMTSGGNNTYDGSIDDIEKDFATEYWYIYDNDSTFFLHENYDTQVDYDVIDGFYLRGINEDKLCEVRKDLSFYVFPKSIENIDGTIDLFNKIFTDPELFADLKYGRQGYEYIYDNDEIKPIRPLAGSYLNLNQILPPSPGLQSYYPQSTDFLQNLPKDLWYEKNVFTEHHAYHDSMSDEMHFGYGNPSILDSLFNKNISVEDSIDQYMIEFKESNRLGFITEMNERLGAITAFDYKSD